MEIKNIRPVLGGGYKWHNMSFSDFFSLQKTVTAAASTLMNSKPKHLKLCKKNVFEIGKVNSWEICKISQEEILTQEFLTQPAARKATIVSIIEVYKENGAVFPV